MAGDSRRAEGSAAGRGSEHGGRSGGGEREVARCSGRRGVHSLNHAWALREGCEHRIKIVGAALLEALHDVSANDDAAACGGLEAQVVDARSARGARPTGSVCIKQHRRAEGALVIEEVARQSVGLCDGGRRR